MVEILVYFAVFLVIIPILLLLFSSIKGMINSKGNIKKTILMTFPLIICISPCMIILGASLYNMLLMMFGGKELLTIGSKLEELCCTAGTWISVSLIGLGILVIIGGAILKLTSRRRIN